MNSPQTLAPVETPEQQGTARSPFINWKLAGRRISNMLLVGVVVMLAYPFATMAWAEWASRNVEDSYDDTITAFARNQPDPLPNATPAEKVVREAGRFARELKAEDAIGRLMIPSIDVDEIVFEGTEALGIEGFDNTLRLGPSHLHWTPLPGRNSNTTIAGHRTTFTRPFWSLDELKNGDRMIFELPYGTFTYEFQDEETVAPFQTYVAEDHGFEELTLSTCTPRYSAHQRLIAHGRLVAVETPDGETITPAELERTVERLKEKTA